MELPPLLALLNETERQSLLEHCRRLRFAKGDVVISEGARAKSLQVILTGRLGVQLGTALGDYATINVLGPGDYFGELALVDAERPARTASVVALEDSTTLAMTAAAFRELQSRHPAVQDMLITLLARRVNELSAGLIEALYSGLDDRLRHRLAQLATVYSGPSGPNGQPVRIPLTQQQLASMIGGTRPTVNQILGRLQEAGYIEVTRGAITVHNVAALASP